MKGLQVIFEIKQLHLSIGRRLFEMHNEKLNHRHPSPLQMEVISILIDREGQDIFSKDLQEELKVSKAAISDVIDKMERKGLVLREPSEKDGRKTRILLLDEGKKIFMDMEDNMKAISEEILMDVTEEEVEEFLRISEKIINNIRKREENDKII